MSTLPLGRPIRTAGEEGLKSFAPGGIPAPAAGFGRSVPIAEIVERDGILSPRQYVEPPDRAPAPERARAQVRQHGVELAALRMRPPPGRLSSTRWTRCFDGPPRRSTSGPSECCTTGARASWLVLAPLNGAPADGAVPLVLPRNLRHSRVSEVDLAVVLPSVAAGMRRYRLRSGDVVGACTGELGRYGLLGPEQAGRLLGPGCLRLRPDPEVDPAFLPYHLGTPTARDWLDRHATGSTIRSISPKALTLMPVAIPPPEPQRQIGAALGAPDAAASLHDRIGRTATRLRAAWAEALMR